MKKVRATWGVIVMPPSLTLLTLVFGTVCASVLDSRAATSSVSRIARTRVFNSEVFRTTARAAV
ncbi:MAG TPA: hypothetical protein VLD18_13010, partial [Verrucomicrobiae bacterium]|nr:hypothetical protein [Verrucomicrobiae bacterium]